MHKKRILIIEDEPVLLGVLVKKLEQAGYEPIRAEDGAIGLAKVKEERPDLILLDLLLPQKNGLEVLEEIRKNADLASLPVIVISNSGQPVEVKRVLELGVLDYIVKAEFNPNEVLEKVRNALKEGEGAKQAATENRKEKTDPPTVAKKEGEKSGVRVLVVEDDKFLRNILAAKLAREGFSVEEAMDGKEALQKIEKHTPEFILLDLVMPDIDGFEILKRMKENKEFSKIPVLVLSNLGQDDDIRRAKELGAKDYLVKAYFTPSEIIVRVQKILREVYF